MDQQRKLDVPKVRAMTKLTSLITFFYRVDLQKLTTLYIQAFSFKQTSEKLQDQVMAVVVGMVDVFLQKYKIHMFS